MSNPIPASRWHYEWIPMDDDAEGVSCDLVASDGTILASCLWAHGELDIDSDGCGVWDERLSADDIPWPDEDAAFAAVRGDDENTEAETLEQWAARVAPTLTDKRWREAEQMAANLPAGRGDSGDEARALLAYRDKVAADLYRFERFALLDLRRAEQPCSSNYRRLVQGKLARERTELWTCITDFGREIARVLGAGAS